MVAILKMHHYPLYDPLLFQPSPLFFSINQLIVQRKKNTQNNKNNEYKQIKNEQEQEDKEETEKKEKESKPTTIT
eukprot:m.54158 g.54158  ORF g.54158 m.54158 type:complete len:75 (+) comp7705_c1_seq1:4016-4240(+)